MDFYGCHFEYAGELSRKYGLVIANVDTKRNMQLSGAVQTVSIFNKRNNTKENIGKLYSEAPFVFEMEVVSEDPIDGELRRRIQKWLFNQRGYKKLYIDMADGALGETFELSNGRVQRTYLNCRFINPEKIDGIGGIFGFKFTVECDSHLAWQDPSSETFALSGGAGSEERVSLNVDTDADYYTYPRVTIISGTSGGDISIINDSDSSDRLVSFVGIQPESTIVINGAYNYLSSECAENFVGSNFPRLIDGDNSFRILGDVSSIKFEWQNMRYL